MKWHTRSVLAISLLFFSIMGCESGVGACQSEPVEYSFGLRVYCYSGWDKAECEANNSQQVNGAKWYFHSGQSCEDRGLSEGSNPWP
ncbi:MAG: hypothetical protein OEZ43_20795 [Gammaproteobacteria bacterium]|nr:hypothetical protein [Gammaproteobacteria bacterium]